MKPKSLLLLAAAIFAGYACVFAQAPVSTPAPTPTAAQSSTTSSSVFPKPTDFNSWAIGANLGIAIGHTDLQANSPGLGFGGFLSKTFTHSLTIQGDLFYGIIRGEAGKGLFTPGKSTANTAVLETAKKLGKPHFVTKYKTTVFQYSIRSIFNVGNISFLNRKMTKIVYFNYIGLGNVFTNPTVEAYLAEVRTTPTGTPYWAQTDKKHVNKKQQYQSTMEAMAYIGAGMRYKLNNQFTIIGEATLAVVLNDKIDGITPRGGKDLYSYSSLGLSYSIGKKGKTMEWTNPLEQTYMHLDSMQRVMAGIGGDKDKDGVADLYDKDNATPEGVKVYGDGTTVDTDGDGVPDSKDNDSFSGKGAKVDENGKEVDSDADGVPDSRDLEPNTEKGKLVNFQGITIKVGGGIGSIGGSTTNVSGSGYDSYMPVVFFEFNKYNIPDRYHEGLAALARLLVANPDVKVSLYGNCDAVGTEAANKELGQKRADAVKDYLNRVYGIDKGRMDAISKGKGEPFSNVKNTKDRDPLNRRVDYKLTAK